MLPSAAILSVFLPAVLAVIVTPPQRLDVVEDSDLHLPCSLRDEHRSDTKVVWAWLGVGMDHWTHVPKHFDAARYRILHEKNDRSLTIYGVQLTDAGKFRCSTYYECDDITGRCEGGGNRSAGSYWSTSDSRLRTSYSSIVHDVTVSASRYRDVLRKVYDAIAAGFEPVRRFFDETRRALTPPRINGSNVDNHTVTADHGYWMRLRCIVVESESPVVVEWSINGTVVNDSPPHLSLDQGARPNRYYLTRNDMTSRDEGIYRCKVSNEQGSDEISYVVKVAPPEPYDPDWKPDYTDEAAIGHNGDRYPPVESMEDD